MSFVTPVQHLTFSSHVREALLSSDTPVVVTGGGGWVGRATLEMLDNALGDSFINRVRVYGSSDRILTLRSGKTIQSHSLADMAVAPNCLLAHYAYATREVASRMSLESYVDLNTSITDYVSSFITSSLPKGIFSLSSGAVYLGNDLAKNPYGVLKRRDELQLLTLADQLRDGGHSCYVVIPRLFNLAGPFINKIDSYVLASILEDIRRGGPIQLRSQHLVIRSYVHVRDLINLGFALMQGIGTPSNEPFDTAGECEVEVSELADIARDVLGAKSIDVVRPPTSSSSPDRYVGNSSVFMALVNSCSLDLASLPQQIVDTSTYLASVSESN